MDDAQWKEELTPEQFDVLRRKGTDAPYTGRYYKHDENGVYTCAGCKAELFRSNDKFDSGSGWPSFDRVASSDAVELVQDSSHGMERTEVVCKACGGHLGHLFTDGPKTTGDRFCINSTSLHFTNKDSV